MNFRLVILKGSECTPAFVNLHNQAYDHWKTLWRATFAELDNATSVESDNFSRQDDVLGLFIDDHCVAMVCHRYVDLALESVRDDSYFSTWTDENFAKVKSQGRWAAIGNQISIHPEYRKLPNGIATKDVLLWFSLRHLQNKNIDVIVGAVREDKGLDKLFASYGAEILAQGVQQHNVTVSLVSFEPKNINLNTTPVSQDWLNGIYQFRQEDFKPKKAARAA